MNIVEPVNGHTSWVSPMVVVNKDTGGDKPEVRICIDMRKANQAILRENHVLPVITDFLPQLKRANIFTKLDVKMAFHQVELAPQSRYITAFITKRGVLQYTRLNFGICCAPEMFQKLLERILAGLDGVVNAFDDILIWGENQTEHDARVDKAMQRLNEFRVLLNDKKCIFGAERVPFLGHILSAKGVEASYNKIEAIRNFIAPSNAEQVRSFLGLVTYLGQYIPNLASLSFELRTLLKKDAIFEWSFKQQLAFEKLKECLTSDMVLGYFDVNDRTILFADASPVGLGCALVQIARDGKNKGYPRVISYASKSLTDTEKRYCQTEKEALALVWAVEHNHYYLYGRKSFDLVTDHKPLEVIFGPNSRPCARIERWVMRLNSYSYKVVYRPGKNNIADPLSRLCPPGDKEFDENSEHYVNFVAQNAVPSSMSLTEIAAASRADEELLAIKRALNDTRRDNIKWNPVIELDEKKSNI